MSQLQKDCIEMNSYVQVNEIKVCNMTSILFTNKANAKKNIAIFRQSSLFTVFNCDIGQCRHPMMEHLFFQSSENLYVNCVSTWLDMPLIFLFVLLPTCQHQCLPNEYLTY